MSTNRSNTKRIELQPSATSAHLVWVEFNHPQVDPDTLRAALERHAPGLENLVTPPPKGHAALRRAVQRCNGKLRKGQGQLVWREVGEEAPTDPTSPWNLVVALAEEQRKLDKWDYKATTLAAAACCNRTHKMTTGDVYDADAQAALGDLLAAYNQERGVLASTEIWYLVRSVIERAKGVKLRDGVYVVTDDNLLVQLAEALHEANANTNLVLCAVQPSPSFAQSVQAGLFAELQDLQQLFDKRKARAAESGRALRQDGVENMVKGAMDLRDKALLMRSVLRLELRELEAGIASVTQEAEEILAGKASAA